MTDIVDVRLVRLGNPGRLGKVGVGMMIPINNALNSLLTIAESKLDQTIL